MEGRQAEESSEQRNPQRSGNCSPVKKLVIGAMTLAIVAAIVLYFCFGPGKPRKRHSCEGNLQEMGVVFNEFAADSPGGLWPELSPEAGKLMFRADKTAFTPSIYPKYLEDVKLLICPFEKDYYLFLDKLKSDPLTCLNDQSYYYLGFAVTNDEELQLFAEAYRGRLERGLFFNQDLLVSANPDSAEETIIYRLREGVERLLFTNVAATEDMQRARSKIPVMWDSVEFLDLSLGPGAPMRSTVHIPEGGNVLYMDGHVEFTKYPRKFPITELGVKIMEELDALGLENVAN